MEATVPNHESPLVFHGVAWPPVVTLCFLLPAFCFHRLSFSFFFRFFRSFFCLVFSFIQVRADAMTTHPANDLSKLCAAAAAFGPADATSRHVQLVRPAQCAPLAVQIRAAIIANPEEHREAFKILGGMNEVCFATTSVGRAGPRARPYGHHAAASFSHSPTPPCNRVLRAGEYCKEKSFGTFFFAWHQCHHRFDLHPPSFQAVSGPVRPAARAVAGTHGLYSVWPSPQRARQCPPSKKQTPQRRSSFLHWQIFVPYSQKPMDVLRHVPGHGGSSSRLSTK